MSDDYYSVAAREMRGRGRPTNSPRIGAAQFAASVALQDRANAANVSVEIQAAAEALLAGHGRTGR